MGFKNCYDDERNPDIIYDWCPYHGMTYEKFINEYLQDFVRLGLVWNDNQVISITFYDFDEKKHCSSGRITIHGKYYERAMEEINLIKMIMKAQSMANAQLFADITSNSSLTALLNNCKKGENK